MCVVLGRIKNSSITLICLLQLKVKKSRALILKLRLRAELWDVTSHMGSHSVTCHPTQVTTPRLNRSQIGSYSIYLLGRDGRLS